MKEKSKQKYADDKEKGKNKFYQKLNTLSRKYKLVEQSNRKKKTIINGSVTGDKQKKVAVRNRIYCI